jgi:hypothetical protein
MAADFTTPLSWMKGPNCHLEGTSEKCKMIIETLGEKINDIKKKVSSRFHKANNAEKEDAIIEGSS